jgi:hypothetical protein
LTTPSEIEIFITAGGYENGTMILGSVLALLCSIGKPLNPAISLFIF